ncbi:MAG: PilN domain-containing protein [Patescibacteria group bacterium]|nr:PilN domain-containing protein [Patescibacteria group bacterium]
MLRLNLLAEEAKQTIKYQRLYFLLLKAESILLILAILVGVIVFAAEKMLSANIYQSSQETAKLINASSADYNVKARELNEKMAAVAQIENSHLSYARILRHLAALMPDNISLSFLNIDSDAKTIKLRGLAMTRDDLLNLEKNLKDAPWLKNVNVPLEEKFSQNKIDFDIDMEFDAFKITSD